MRKQPLPPGSVFYKVILIERKTGFIKSPVTTEWFMALPAQAHITSFNIQVLYNNAYWTYMTMPWGCNFERQSAKHFTQNVVNKLNQNVEKTLHKVQLLTVSDLHKTFRVKAVLVIATSSNESNFC